MFIQGNNRQSIHNLKPGLYKAEQKFAAHRFYRPCPRPDLMPGPAYKSALQQLYTHKYSLINKILKLQQKSKLINIIFDSFYNIY